MYPVHWAFECRAVGCKNPAIPGKACCSQQCRDTVQNCRFEGCTNAVEYGWSHGTTTPGHLCYNHGGRFHFDGEPQNNIHPSKNPYVLTVEGYKLAIAEKIVSIE